MTQTGNGFSSAYRTVTKAMILAAGLGSRLKPWTDEHPKALAEVNGKSLLQRNIEYLQQYGINEVVVNVHHFARQIIDAIEKNCGWGSVVNISDETNEVLETGGGLKKAARFLPEKEPFVLMNVDILTDMDLENMIGYYLKHSPLATLATSNRKTTRYFLFDEKDDLCGWKNVKTGEKKLKGVPGTRVERAFSGIHVIDPLIFSLMRQKGKFSMVDVYLDLMHEHTIKSFDHSGSRFIDVGKPGSIGMAEELFQ